MGRRRDGEDEGTDDGGWEHERDPDVTPEWRVRAQVRGAWLDYGLHGRDMALALVGAHKRAGRSAEAVREVLKPASDAMPGQLGLPLADRTEKDTGRD